MRRFSIVEVILMIIVGLLMTVLGLRISFAMINGSTPVNGILIFVAIVLFGMSSVIVYLLSGNKKE